MNAFLGIEIYFLNVPHQTRTSPKDILTISLQYIISKCLTMITSKHVHNYLMATNNQAECLGSCKSSQYTSEVE